MTTGNTGEVFDLNRIIAAGWKLYRRNFLSIAAVVLLISVPVNVILSALPFAGISGSGPYDAWIFRLLSSARILVFNSLVAMAVAKIVETSVDGAPVAWRAVFRHTFGRWGAALSLGPLVVLTAFGLLVLMLVPRLGEALFYALFMFYFLAVSLRSRSGMAAFDYARGMFEGRFGQVFWCQFVFFLFSAAFTAAMLPLMLVFPRVPAVAVGFNAILDLFLAYPFTMSTLFFLDLEALRKGECNTVG
ncbi:MAG: hypothetical protein HGB02_05995 [Chlorobiaceae bacterium]|nr:hypothetical protein [Chlorobiaceae bacterium]